MKYMLDTNICIYVQKNKPDNVAKHFLAHYDEGLCISVITLSELLHGVEKSSNKERNIKSLSYLLDVLGILPFGEEAAYEYGKICAYLEKQGTPIGKMDMLIAAHARAEHLTIVTNNVREFSRVPNLSVENWAV